MKSRIFWQAAFEQKRHQFLLKKSSGGEKFTRKQIIAGRSELKVDSASNLEHRFQPIKMQITPGEHETYLSEITLLKKKVARLEQFLRQFDLYFWEISSWLDEQDYQLLNSSGLEMKKKFSQKYIYLRWRSADGNFYEIGEGQPSSELINLNGLEQRLLKIVQAEANRRGQPTADHFSLIIPPGNGALLLHELLGHFLEADYIYQKLSPFSVRDIGRKIASSKLTILLGNRHDPLSDFFQTDDYGESPQSNELISQGVIRNLICDHFHGIKLKVPASGFCRQEHYFNPPQVRMLAFYVQSGDVSREEIISSTKYGLLIDDLQKGVIDLAKKRLRIIANNAIWIENGELTNPAARIVLDLNPLQLIEEIELIGNDFRFDRGISFCHKKGQTVPIRLGQPTIRFRRIEI